MTNESLAGYANLSLYSAMAVFTIAMVCHAVYLAALLPARDGLRAKAAERDRELVGAGAPVPAEAPSRPELSSRAAKAAEPRGGAADAGCRSRALRHRVLGNSAW